MLHMHGGILLVEGEGDKFVCFDVNFVRPWELFDSSPFVPLSFS